MQYGKRVKAAYMDFKEQYQSQKAKLQEIDKEFNAERLSGVVYAEKVREIEDAIAAARLSALENVKAITDEHREAVAAWNDYKPEQITQDAELLKIGVALGVERLERLAEKHKDNPLMQNLIMNKANEENVHINVPGFWMKDYRESEFASYAGRAAMSIREPESIRAGLFEADYSVPDVVNVDY